jgi:hypothetical protein
VLPVLALAACGDKGKPVATASYTCADFSKSLRTKGDDTAGRFINELRKKASLGQDSKTERREITLGIYFACRGKPGSTKPGAKALDAAKLMKTGKFRIPAPPATSKKKSNK